MGNRHCTSTRGSSVIERNCPEIRNPNYFDGYDYIAKEKFIPSGPGELKLNKGDKVKVVRLSDDESSALVERLKKARYINNKFSWGYKSNLSVHCRPKVGFHLF